MGLLRTLLSEGKPPAVPVLPNALPKGTKLGSWSVVHPLGSGGGGVVYLVERWGRLFALKLAVRPGDRRLLREGRLLRRVRHPRVVRLFGQGWWLGRKRGLPYLVMEYVEGLPLYEWARSTNPTARQIVELLIQAAQGLDAVHRERSVHRDVKGTNALVRPGGRELVLVDLGAGDYEGATPLTSHVLPPGTEVYLSPEAMEFARAHATDKQARYKARPSDDLYALGVMAHRVLTDEYPFPVHMSRDMFWLAVETCPAPNAHEENPRVPAALAAIIQRLLAKRPEERYASAAEVAKALQEAAEKAGPEWDEPLFEWYAGPELSSRTTLAAVPAGPIAPGHEAALRLARENHRERQEWMREQRQVRRRPLKLSQKAADVPAPAPDKTPALKGPSSWRRAGALLALMLALMAGAMLFSQRHEGNSVPSDSPSPTLDAVQASTTQEVGNPEQEVARAPLPPDAAPGAVPPDSEASTSAPVAPTMHLKEDMRVNPPAKSDLRDQKKLSSKPSAAPRSKLSRVVPLCVGLGCASSTQAVRSGPPPEDCPPGAVENMRAMDIEVGDISKSADFFLGTVPGSITVKEGWATITVRNDFGTLPRGTPISGLISFGDRIYGRFTVAHLPNRTVPVCMEALDDQGRRGMNRRRESTATEVKVFSLADLRAVDHFE